jgi:thioesterase domain-containing protein
MARQLEDAGDALQFVAILDQPIKPVNGFEGEFNRAQIADYVLQLVADYFQGYKILTPPYPDWIYELRSKLEQYAPEEMVPFISKFASEKIPQKSRSIKYFSRLVNIRFSNEAMVYHPSGKISTALILLRAIKSEWDHPDEDLGWSSYADDVRIHYVTGNHLNMIWGANALAVAKHLTQRIV